MEEKWGKNLMGMRIICKSEYERCVYRWRI